MPNILYLLIYTAYSTFNHIPYSKKQLKSPKNIETVHKLVVYEQSDSMLECCLQSCIAENAKIRIKFHNLSLIKKSTSH